MNPSPSLYRALPTFSIKSGQGAVHCGEKDARPALTDTLPALGPHLEARPAPYADSLNIFCQIFVKQPFSGTKKPAPPSSH